MPDESFQPIAYVKPLLPESEPVDVELEHADAPILDRWAPGLVVSYVVDCDTHLEFVSHGALKRSGRDREWLRIEGLDGLWQAIGGSVSVQGYDGIFAVLAGGTYEASLVLLDDLWDRAFREFVPEGPYLVALPERDILAFGPDTAEARAELEAVIERIWPEGDHLISERLYRRVEGEWERVE